MIRIITPLVIFFSMINFANAQNVRQCTIESIGHYCKTLIDGAIKRSANIKKITLDDPSFKAKPTDGLEAAELRKGNYELAKGNIKIYQEVLTGLQRRILSKVKSEYPKLSKKIKNKNEANTKTLNAKFEQDYLNGKGKSQSKIGEHRLFKVLILCTLRGEKKDIWSFVRGFKKGCKQF